MLKGDYPVSLLCDLLAVSRSSSYYQPAEANESELREAVNQLAAQFPTYGSRRLAAQLRRAPYELTVNRKRVQRVMREEQIDCRVKRRAIQTADMARVPALSESGRRSGDHTPGSSLGLGHHLHPLARRVRLPGGDHGCLHPNHARLATRLWSWRGVDARRAGTGSQ